ncbi:MAG: histidine phosphatase family protein [Proteobacteria bacterium]|nr:histidine phosphatase family protein [Pseudomonadota bacterium]
MKSLFLLRHAKSSWSDPGLEDRQRPLNKRGKRDAPIMGDRLRARNEYPDLILTSPALRARCTAELFANACGYSPEMIVEEAELYFSSTRSIEGIIVNQDDRYRSLMLVFHNPDITQLVNSIDAAIRIDNIPTCGMVKLVSDIDRWRDWSVSNTRFEYFDTPKRISV